MLARRALLACLLASALIAPSAARAEAWVTHGPDMGWVLTLLRPFGPGGPLYAGTYGGGVFQSPDGGRSWRDISGDLAGAVVWDLAWGDDLVGSLYAATEGRGLFRSDVNGGEWTPRNAGLGVNLTPTVQRVAIHPEDPLTLTIATSDGIYTSHDRGASWPDSLHWLDGFPFRDVARAPQRPNLIVALQDAALYTSLGRYGLFDRFPIGPPGAILWDLQLWPSDPDTVFVLSLDDGLFRATDGVGFEAVDMTSVLPDGGRLYQMRLAPGSGELVVAGVDGVFASADRGESWRRLDGGSPRVEPEIWSVLIDDAAPLRLHLGSFSRGFLSSGDGGGDWTEFNEGLRAAWITVLRADEAGLLAGTAHGRLFESLDGGESWIDRSGDLDALQIAGVLRLSGTGRLLISTGSGVFLSDDDGAHWRAPAEAPAQPIGHRFAHPSWAGEEHVLLATASGVFESLDAGERWRPLPGQPSPGADVFAIAVSPGDGRVWIGADREALYAGPLGGPYERVFTPRFVSDRFRDLAFPDGTGREVLVATNGDVYRLQREEGIHGVVSLGAGLPGYGGVLGVRAAAVAVDGGGARWWVGTQDGGVYVTEDRGRSWSAANEGLRSLHIEDLAVDVTGERLYAGTLARGVFFQETGGTTLALGEGEGGLEGPAPKSKGRTGLRPNVPNPFNPATEIRLELEREARLSLEIFDLRGRRRAVLFEGRRSAGPHAFRFEGRDGRGRPLPSGVYLVRMRVGARSWSQRIVLLR